MKKFIKFTFQTFQIIETSKKTQKPMQFKLILKSNKRPMNN
jgi:hypothetical protein